MRGAVVAAVLTATPVPPVIVVVLLPSRAVGAHAFSTAPSPPEAARRAASRVIRASSFADVR